LNNDKNNISENKKINWDELQEKSKKILEKLKDSENKSNQ